MEVRADDAKRQRILVFAIALTAICIACSSLALITALLARREEAAQRARSTATLPAAVTLVVATETPPIVTSPASETNSAEATQLPSDAPILEATATPALLQGKGDEKVDVERGRKPSIAHITHFGSGHFSVINYGSDGKRISLLVNTTGNYDGVVPIDFMVGEHTAQFRVEADGEWTIEIQDLLAARTEDIPGVIEGSGDEVVVINGGSPHVATVETSGDGNFAVWSYGNSYDLVVNESAPYRGSVALDPHAFFLVISADSDWSLSITARE
jgi:hypothetical protein